MWLRASQMQLRTGRAGKDSKKPESAEVHMGAEVSKARLGQHWHKAVVLDGLQRVCVGLVAPIVYYQGCAALCCYPLPELAGQIKTLWADLQHVQGIPCGQLSSLVYCLRFNVVQCDSQPHRCDSRHAIDDEEGSRTLAQDKEGNPGEIAEDVLSSGDRAASRGGSSSLDAGVSLGASTRRR